MSRATRGTRSPGRAFIGKYVLDSLSLGMYDYPLMAIREYVQNSVDAIDEVSSIDLRPNAGKGCVEITVDGREKSLTIRDDGTGVAAAKAWRVLHDLGSSGKDRHKNRGFRGIGRLGGLGYCERMVFTTKAKGESLVSTSMWDCEYLRNLVSEKGDHSVASIIERVVTFLQQEYDGCSEDHFFIVRMENVRSSRGVMLNVPAIKAYLSQVAPVPFDDASFKFGKETDQALRDNVPSYETYCVSVNGQTIYKPYSDMVGINQHNLESISGIKHFQLSHDTDVLAFGWLTELELRGTIWPSSHVDGLRLRSGNIQVGDRETLSELYREKRFGNYLAGEVHVVDPRLILNSRRDDLEDNQYRDNLHSSFIKEIGIPYSRRIRDLSAERSRQNKLEDADSLIRRASTVAQDGYLAESQKLDLLRRLSELDGATPGTWTEGDIATLIQRVQKSKHILSGNHSIVSSSGRSAMKRVFETVYRETENKAKAEALIAAIMADLSSPTTD